MKQNQKNVELVKKTTVSDTSDTYVTKELAGYGNVYNNNIHYHSFYELEFIIEGSGKYEINNTVFDIKRGALFLTPPADYHTYSLTEDEKIRYYNVQFFPLCIDDEISSRLYSYSVPIALYFSEEETADILRKFDELERVFNEKSSMYALEVRNLIENLCIETIRKMDRTNVNSVFHPTIKNAIIYVKEHYREEITLDMMAEYVGLSSTYFSHKFMEAVGVGFSTYVRDIRLNSAANLIKSTQLTVKEICYKTGFTDPNYFSNAFRSAFGMSPRKYREQNMH